MKKRISALAQNLPENCTAVIENVDNRFYFTDFHSSLGYLVVNKNGAIFLTDSRYVEAATNHINGAEVVEFFSHATIKDVLAKLGATKVIMQSETTTVASATALTKAFDGYEVVFDDTLDKIIASLRVIKDEGEVDYIIKAQRIAEDALTHVLGLIKVGMTEKELALALDFYMLSHGADALSFDTIAVSGKNSSLPHGVPSDKRIENGDFITMDFGAVYKGYHSDMTRTVAVGNVCDEQKKVYETVLEAQLRALDGVREGIRCCDADALARNVITQAGYGDFFRHGLGHGVGVEIHEAPTVSSKSDAVLKKNMIVTVEPGIYLPNRFGVRIEDMVCVTENGCKNLTNAPKELIIL
ncbi:MAG: aminopeptidase P family protein [Clostridia bacterium]|nr:aminopeptidase P family protein [Clostridia bacterium]